MTVEELRELLAEFGMAFGLEPDADQALITAQLAHALVGIVEAHATHAEETEIALFHWRDRNGAEIDSVLESGDGRGVGIEVKAGRTPTRSWFRHLDLLRAQLGAAMVAGVVLYTGDQAGTAVRGSALGCPDSRALGAVTPHKGRVLAACTLRADRCEQAETGRPADRRAISRTSRVLRRSARGHALACAAARGGLS